MGNIRTRHGCIVWDQPPCHSTVPYWRVLELLSCVEVMNVVLDRREKVAVDATAVTHLEMWIRVGVSRG